MALKGDRDSARSVRHVGLVQRARSWLGDVRRQRAFVKAHRAAASTSKPGPHALVVVLDHPTPDGSPPNTVRLADAFGARAVYVVGTDHIYPPRSLRDVPVRLFRTFGEAHAELAQEGYTIFALTPRPEAGALRFLHTTALPEKTAFVIGNEVTGLTFTPEEYPGVLSVTIAQYGGLPWLQSTWVAGIVMYEYVRQHGKAARD